MRRRTTGVPKVLEVTNVDFSMRQFLMPLMVALRDSGCSVIGACADGPDLAAVRQAGFRVETLPFQRSLAPLAQWRAFLAVRHLIKRERPDIVHAHMPISGILTRFAAWSCGVPVVAYTCHGFLFNQPGSWRRRTFAFVLEWLAGKVTDIYMTVSREEADDARRWRIHPAPVAIGNGREIDVFRPDAALREAVRSAMSVDAARVVVVTVSRIVRHKGFPELLRAMDMLPDVELWIVGERLASDHGDDMSDEFARAHERLGDRLRLLGRRDDVAALMVAADIFVLASHFEGLPMSIIEAMLCGLPVVTTDIRGPREQIVDGDTGFLVTPGLAMPLACAIGRLAKDAALRKAMGEAARARACALYDSRTVNKQTVALLLRTN